VEGPYKHVGLAIRSAIYRNGMPLDTVEQRRAAYFGTVGVGFDFHQLMREAIGQSESLRYLRVRITDLGPSQEYAALSSAQPSEIFDSRRDLFKRSGPDTTLHDDTTSLQATVEMPFTSRTWKMDITADPSLMLSEFDRSLPYLVLLVCLLS